MRGEDAVLARLELFFGAAKSGQPAESATRIERFAAGRVVLSCDLHVARNYGRLKHNLGEKGRPIPENDIWIAATALCHGLSVATRDRHFREIDDLRVDFW